MDAAFDLEQYIMHHLLDSHQWRLPFLPPINLPPFLSLHGLMLILCSTGLIILFCFVYRKQDRVPRGITNVLEAFVIFIRDQLAEAYLGKEDGKKYTPFLCTLFFFLLGLNLLGLIPIFSTATANINVTAGLALIIFFLMVLGTIFQNGLLGFCKALIPSGVPFPVLFLLVPIEAAGLAIKSFALMIRLFANMLAGHIVIISLMGIVVILGLAALPAVLLAVGIYMLEVFVALLQAYIFTMLSAMFIGQMRHPEH